MNTNRIWTTRLPTTYREKRRSWKKKRKKKEERRPGCTGEIKTESLSYLNVIRLEEFGINENNEWWEGRVS